MSHSHKSILSLLSKNTVLLIQLVQAHTSTKHKQIPKHTEVSCSDWYTIKMVKKVVKLHKHALQFALR